MWDAAHFDELQQHRIQSMQGGGDDRIAKQHAAGKLTARERIDLLLDEGSFLEIGAFREARPLANGEPYSTYPGDGVVTGFGKINGRSVCVASEDFTVNGGTLGETHSKKICDIIDAALAAQVPFISINDSGGARIQESVVSLAGYSEIFLKNVMASGVIPQIAAIMGTCAGGACYSPALCDFVFMTKDCSRMFVTGPSAVKSATGEIVDFDELGGARVHDRASGVSHFVCEDDAACLSAIRELLNYLPQNSSSQPEVLSKYSHDRSQELASIVPDNLSQAYDVHRVIDAICDEGSFLEVQCNFAPNAVVGFSRLQGKVLGIVANQPAQLAGAIDINASDKIARFVRVCDCFNIPLLTLVDTPGYMPGKMQEHGGIIRHGAKVLYAYCEATVPKVTLITRKAYGGAYIAMNSKRMAADCVFGWPIAQIAVMSADGGVEIVHRKEIASAENPDELRAELVEDYKNRFLNPYFAAKNGLIDEVILPQETRQKIAQTFDYLAEKPRRRAFQELRQHGNIPL